MDKKELLFPGIILGIVLVIAVGLIISLPKPSTGLPSDTATSTGSFGSTTPNGASGSSAGSGTTAPSSYYPYGSVTLSIGEVAGFKDGLSIRPINVLEDSRCPVDVQCIQAGTVRISLKTSVNEQSSVKELKLGESVTVNGDRITFVSATPERNKQSSPAFNTYRLTFRVEPTSMNGGNGTGTGRCYVGGCSSEICSDRADQVSNCMYSESYACYKTAKCERQTSGSCGWTQTSELKKCLANPPSMR